MKEYNEKVLKAIGELIEMRKQYHGNEKAQAMINEYLTELYEIRFNVNKSLYKG